MFGIRSSTLLLWVVAPVAGAQEGPPAAPPEGVVAKVNGTDLSLDGYRDWLLATHGWRHLDDYINLNLLRAEATRMGLPLPTADDLDAAFEQDWQDQILWRHAGDDASWQEELRKSGLDRAGYRDRRAGSLELEVVARRILQHTPMTDVQRHELWEREFTKEGIRTHVRVAFFTTLKGVRPGQKIDSVRSKELDLQARARADAFLAAVRGDPSQFAARVTSDSDPCTIARFDSYPIDLRARGGEIPRLRADHFGGAVLDALADAKSGDLAGPIVTPGGLYVVQVVERAPRPFEGAEKELDQIWQERSPSQGEIVHLTESLRAAAEVQRYPIRR